MKKVLVSLLWTIYTENCRKNLARFLCIKFKMRLQKSLDIIVLFCCCCQTLNKSIRILKQILLQGDATVSEIDYGISRYQSTKNYISRVNIWWIISEFKVYKEYFPNRLENWFLVYYKNKKHQRRDPYKMSNIKFV